MGEANADEGDDELAAFLAGEEEAGGRSAANESSLLSKEVAMVAAVSMDSSTCPRKKL